MTIATFPLPPRDGLGNPQPLPGRFVTTLPVTPGATVVIGAPSGSGEITVLSPQGQPIASGSGSVTVSPTTSRVVLTVDAPQPGYVTAVQVAEAGTLLPDPSTSGLVLGSTGVEQGDWDWTSPANLGAPGAVGEVLTATGTGVGDYDWAAPAAQVPTPAQAGQVLVSTGAAAGDLEWLQSGGGALAVTAYAPSTTVTYSLGTTLAALDTTNLAAPFVAPPSGAVLVTVVGYVTPGTTEVTFGVVNASGAQLGDVFALGDIGTDFSGRGSVVVGGLTPGDEVTLYAAARAAASGEASVYAGGSYGLAAIVVEGMP